MTFRFLMSYHYGRETDLAAIAALYDGPAEVFADSGAFSAVTTGATIKLADYAAWLQQWRGLITTAATLDVIGDPAATERNTGLLEDRGLTVLPVFHAGSPWPGLERLCARYRYVALGGMVPYTRRRPELMRWLVRCFRIARDHGTVFHGFGQTSIAPLAALPFYSVDSSTWSTGARYGAMNLWDDRRGRLVQVTVGRPETARAHAGLLRSYGVDPAVVGQPGFGLLSRRDEARYRAEDHLNRGVPAVAYDRLGRWLARRHKVPAPPGWATTGTVLYLADTSMANFRHAATEIAADHKRERTP